MKKLAAILLLSLLAFNWYGYRLFSAYLEREAAAAMETRLDANEYKEQELTEFRIPLNLPYQTNWKDFERFEGEVEVAGVHYKYVKRKVQDGHLVVLCLPNEAKMKLQNSRDDFFKLVNDLQQPTKKSDKGNHPGFKSFTSEYWQPMAGWKFNLPPVQCSIQFACASPEALAGFITTIEQPPDAYSISTL